MNYPLSSAIENWDILAMLGGFILAAIIWWKTRKLGVYTSRFISRLPKYLEKEFKGKVSTPPSDLPAPAVSIFKQPTVERGTVLAVMVELCQKGILSVEAKEQDPSSGVKRRLYLHKNGSSDLPWEKELLSKIPATAKVKNLRQYGLSGLKDSIANELGELLQNRGLFKDNPVRKWRETSKQRKIWLSLSKLACVILGVGAGVRVSHLIKYEFPTPWIVGFLVGCAVWVITWIFTEHSGNIGRTLPTVAGKKELAQWYAFDDNLSSSIELQLHSYFPYLIAMAGAGDYLVYDKVIDKAASSKIGIPIQWGKLLDSAKPNDSLNLS
jgi:hypothetical protein